MRGECKSGQFLYCTDRWKLSEWLAGSSSSQFVDRLLALLLNADQVHRQKGVCKYPHVNTPPTLTSNPRFLFEFPRKIRIANRLSKCQNRYTLWRASDSPPRLSATRPLSINSQLTLIPSLLSFNCHSIKHNLKQRLST